MYECLCLCRCREINLQLPYLISISAKDGVDPNSKGTYTEPVSLNLLSSEE